MCTVGLAALAVGGPAASLAGSDPGARAFSARWSGTMNLATDRAAAK